MTTRTLGSLKCSALHTRYIVAPCKAETLRGLCLPFVSFCSLPRANNDRPWSYSRTSEACFTCQWNIPKLYGNIWRRHKRIHVHTHGNGVVPEGASPVQWKARGEGEGYEDARASLGIFASSFSTPLAANIFINSLIKHTRILPCSLLPGAKWIHWH